MKTLKKLTLGVLAAGVLTGSASASTPTAQVVHVAGSTAFRTGTTIAIIDTLAGKATPSASATTDVYAAFVTSGKNITNDSEEIFANGHIDGSAPVATIIVETNWTGSLTGVVDLVAGQSHTAFLDETNANVQAALTLAAARIPAGTYAGGTLITSPVFKASGDTVQLALSDSINTTIAKELAGANLSGSIGSFSTIGALATAVGSSALQNAGTSTLAAKAGVVGVVPFQWFLGTYSTAPTFVPTNITQQEASALFTNGFLPQSSFTGTNTGTGDQSTTFYLVGRNEDSGTRIGALSESQFGVTASPTQWILGNDSNSLTANWSVTTATGTATGSGIAPFPDGAVLNFEPQISWSGAGHSGYNSGGNVQAALNISTDGTVVPPDGDFNTTAAYFIGYLGLTDGNAAVTGHATALTYNGVPFSNHAVANGSYTFWTFEHAYRLSTGYTTVQSATVNSIADNLYGRDADSIYSSGTVSHAEATVGSGVYTEGATAGTSPGNAGLLFDAGFTATRGLTEGGPVISNN